MAINLRKKYEQCFTKMSEDAALNVAEASKELEHWRGEVSKCEERLNALKATATEAKEQFLIASKTLQKLVRQKSPDPEEIANVLKPFNAYIGTARQIISVEEELQKLEDSEWEAGEGLQNAEADINCINHFK